MVVGNWDEFRTALQVARLGTVSAAAELLGVHHATVIRHVDALEAELGVKLFQRHARGYTATEAGEDLLKVTGATEDQLTQLVARIKGRSSAVTGELVITTLTGVASALVPALAEFQALHPDLRVRVLSDQRVFRLEYGEAHLAIRAGARPQEPDNVVQHLADVSPWLCASRGYVARFGLPDGPEEFGKHRFVGGEKSDGRAPPVKWLQARVPAQNFVFRASEQEVQEAAVRAGVGIGFVLGFSGRDDPDLVAVGGQVAEWQSSLWLVTHVDLHRTQKVQAILGFLKNAGLRWS